MATKNEGAMMTRWRFLRPCMAVVLSLASTALCQAPGEDPTTTQATTTTTIPLKVTRTITIQATAPTAAPGEKMQGGEEYVLLGCYGQDDPSDIGTVLGSDYAVRNATGKNGMSLSMCLEACGSPASQGVQARDGEHLSLYVGVTGGTACYCGASINSTASVAPPKNCTLPCAGNDAVACGGLGYMLIYKLTTPPEPATTAADGPYDDGAGDKGKPGVTAGIALGSISGFGVLLSIIFFGAKMYRRRRQRQASVNDEHDLGIGNGDGAGETAKLGNSKSRINLRRVDPIVVAFSPVDASRRASNAGWTKEITAATTGAEWGMVSPVTPRVNANGPPRLATKVSGDQAWDDIPHTPTILVQNPESVAAQTFGLGERAWHRRRLSTPLPPAGYDDGNTTRGREPRGAIESSPRHPENMNMAYPMDTPPWEEGPWDAFVPAPLTLPRLGRDIDDASSLSEGDGAPLSPRWTKWTMPSTCSLAGSPANGAGEWEKAGKKD